MQTADEEVDHPPPPPFPSLPRERETLQVQSYLVEQLDAETEMEPIETKNIRLQTMNTVVIEMSVQSEDLGVTNSMSLLIIDIRNIHLAGLKCDNFEFDEERKSPSKMASAKRRLKKAFARRQDMKRRNSAGDLLNKVH